MVKETKEEKPASEPLGAAQLQVYIAQLQGHIEDLRGFDVKTVQERYDKRIKVLSDEINGTIAAIYGQNTPKYWQNAIASLDNLPTVIGGARYPIDKVREVYQMGIDEAATKLDALVEKLDSNVQALEGQQPADKNPSPAEAPSGGGRVFVVHGRDDGVKETVTRFLDKMDLKPVLFHDRQQEGETALDRLGDQEKGPHAFAVFALTTEDLAGSNPSRQGEVSAPSRSMLFDLGFFLGSLGRERVIALRSGNGPSPLDYYGVRTLPLDDGALWELLLARDMKRAGLNVDMNKAV
jgi:predicted nucleotide-binding protein